MAKVKEVHFFDNESVDWAVPDFSTLSRRQKTLKVNIPYRGSEGPRHLLVDSTGIKVEGEGEWNARKHGGAKRRVWRKIRCTRRGTPGCAVASGPVR
mgnify:CR=1 FL=1